MYIIVYMCVLKLPHTVSTCPCLGWITIVRRAGAQKISLLIYPTISSSDNVCLVLNPMWGVDALFLDSALQNS